MNWFYEKNGEQHGPVSEADLTRMYACGDLTVSNLVWREPMPDWVTYGSIFKSKAAVERVAPLVVGTRRGDTCAELRAVAWQALSGNWLIAGVVVLLGQMLMQASGMLSIIPVIGLLAPLFMVGPLWFGMSAYSLGLIRGESVEVGTLFSGFSLWLKHTGLFLLTNLVLGLALLISSIPGGVLLGLGISRNPELLENDPLLMMADLVFVTGLAMLFILPLLVGTYVWARYALVYFIAIDESEMGVVAIMSRSARMMKGQVGKFSWLLCSYTGWYILGFLAFVIGIFWSTAYLMAGFAAYYDDLLERHQSAESDSV